MAEDSPLASAATRTLTKHRQISEARCHTRTCPSIYQISSHFYSLTYPGWPEMVHPYFYPGTPLHVNLGPFPGPSMLIRDLLGTSPPP